MEHFLSVLKLFPLHLRTEINQMICKNEGAPEEIRVKLGSPITVRRFHKESFGTATVTRNDLRYIIGNATECSYHAAARHIRNGYIPLQGGSRMGLCGVGSGEDGLLSSVDEVTSICIRLASEIHGCADKIFPELMNKSFCNTIIIAPPGAGKTTLLRELIRKISYSGLYVGVADERGEVSGQSFDLGPRCDVLTGVSKSDGAMMLLRSMSPNVIAMDEITAYGDMSAILEAVGCGVSLLTTMHGDGLEAVRKPGFAPLYEIRVFEKAVLVHVKKGQRIYEVVELYD